jgi:hypothetical protein
MKTIEIIKEIEGFPLKVGQIVYNVSDEAAHSMITDGNAKIYEEKAKPTKASK